MTSSTPAGARTALSDVLLVLDLADVAGGRLWLDGGWGVDALIGHQTREHGDVDIVIEAQHLEAFVESLFHNGFRPVGEDGATAWNFLLARVFGAVVDVHAITLDEEGNGVLGPPERNAVYPAAALTGQGSLGGRSVHCISAEWAVRFHDEYEGDAHDRADVRALCERFGLTVPGQYR